MNYFYKMLRYGREATLAEGAYTFVDKLVNHEKYEEKYRQEKERRSQLTYEERYNEDRAKVFRRMR
ncbi:hypothetical protein [Paenibacillus cremeus]|uniref:Uncharacterized protein n=1 Tax=Paenibacillus cremeus TaxID=2163881 RepID=A0A559JCG3_9BACL|nr:hypothetical protein [Paenibacillus cremeus]TVX97560.1 hypothetical protein FPZ49_35015 [Paenibacillus cremeus]